MTILDKLLEKKDLNCYCKERMKQLRRTKLENEPERRQNTKRLIEARISELKLIMKFNNTNKIKMVSKDLWRKNND